MHDPMVVAFTIRRPWPCRDRSHDARPGKPRWHMRYQWATWWTLWKPGTWTVFWVLAGRGWYWPSLITIWHVEPRGHDSGEVCKHYRRDLRPDGTWSSTVLHEWRWHVHHWRIQVHPLQALRRWALTRCAWCGGRQGKRDPVDVSHSWDGPRGHWWQGEPGLYHHDCSSIAGAHAQCLCADPVLEHSGYGGCARCGKTREFGVSDFFLEQRRILASVPAGQRDPVTSALVEARWKAHEAEAAEMLDEDGTPP
jgi:hypothetical protein